MFLQKFSGWCCSSSPDGVMLVHDRKVGFLTTNIERSGGGFVTFKLKGGTGSMN